MLKKIIVLVVLAILIAVGIFYKKYNKPHVNIEEATPDISLDSEFLKNEFSQDENKANAEYLDQIIQVKGTILNISSERDKTIITLGSKDALGSEDIFGNISCHMLEENEQQKNLKIGQTVAIKGICTGYLLDVILIRCVPIN